MKATVLIGDCRQILPTLPDESVQCCITSPPYWGLRDYGHKDQIGMEPSPFEYIENLVSVFREVKRVLKNDGTLWLNLGDSYAIGSGTIKRDKQRLDQLGQKMGTGGGHKHSNGLGNETHKRTDCGIAPKNLIGVPWRVALALQADGWFLRSDIIWHKPNAMPESVTDRPSKSHEYLFLLAKSGRYYYDIDAIREPHKQDSIDRIGRGRSENHKWTDGPGNQTIATDLSKALNPKGKNKRTVWEVATKNYDGAHFAIYPEDLIKPCISAGSKPGDIVLDPFGGSGTTGKVALELNRQPILIELNPEYGNLINERVCQPRLDLYGT